jgi:hypothetical protein
MDPVSGKWVIGGTLEIKEGASVTGITTATLVNDLTTGGTDKALTAEQGKTLKTAVDAKYTAANATAVAAGLVKQAAVVAEAAGATPTAAEFKALLDALKAAGLMATT